MHIHAEDTHLLNLNKQEDDLLNQMDRKDRYLITRAQKEGVIIKNENSKVQIETLIKMHQNHSKREN
jgi:lipid II:glycine glycyltransferase (peptidoglycan interpeptide bridge formation enzyme)